MLKKLGLVLLVLLVLAALAWKHLLAPLWIPLAMLLVLLLLPPYAISKSGESMLKGLFDLGLSFKNRIPIRLIVVTLCAFAVAGAADAAAHLMLTDGPARFGFERPDYWPLVESWISPTQSSFSALIQALALSFFAAYVAAFAIYVSHGQRVSRSDKSRPLIPMIAGALMAIAAAGSFAWWLICGDSRIVSRLANATRQMPVILHLGPGYIGDAWAHQVTAILSFGSAYAFYVALGFYGWRKLGKSPTIPALAGALMAVMVLGQVGAAAEFFVGRWSIPLFLLMALGAAISHFLRLADHTYAIVDRIDPPAPSPVAVLTAKNRDSAILVASAGGGIQAAAWTAQVLEGLSGLYGKQFEDALRFISSISGGSIGTATYLNWLIHRNAVPLPTDAASASSLDEVGWGLAWPDLWRLLLPWPCGMFMDRARAMEIAWLGNTTFPGRSPELAQPLSSWNGPVEQGLMPAVIMGATMVEVGAPLLLGTSDVNGDPNRCISTGWTDGDDLHQKDKAKMDIPVVRAARLSASFPYVSPTAKPENAGHQPHICDGGLYDNYGMATLTEWLDQALDSTQQVKRVLVIQINGFPDSPTIIPTTTTGGWLAQIMGPVNALVNVRTTGQVSHRDIELKMLQDKWSSRGVDIQDVNFNFNPVVHGHAPADPPLSWHLMPRQIAAVREMWNKPSNDIDKAKQKVGDFLAG